MAKQVKLKMDEFHPKHYKTNFWMLPKPVAADTTLSPGAKLLYATLFGLANGSGAAFATQKKLSDHLGKSTRMINRYKEELEQAGLIRVLQRGRGLSNHYYLLRHPMLGNAEEGEFEPGVRPLYRDRQYNTQTIVSKEDGLFIYEDRLREWFEASCAGVIAELPKPGFKISKVERMRLETKYTTLLAIAVASGRTVAAPTDEAELSSTAVLTEEVGKQSIFTAAPSNASLDYDAIFALDSNSNNNTAIKLSSKPTELTGPHGGIIKGPSSQECYEAAMKRRKKKIGPRFIIFATTLSSGIIRV